MQFGRDERARQSVLDILKAGGAFLTLALGSGLGQELYSGVDHSFEPNHYPTLLFFAATVASMCAAMVVGLGRTQSGE